MTRSRTRVPRQSFDVAVLGGGPAGCATALALRARGVERVLVAEAESSGGPQVGETVPPATRRLLARLGVWEEFAGQGHERCSGSCSAWGRDRLGYNDFLFDPLGHGWHLDRGRFDGLLARRAAAAGATVRPGARFVSAEGGQGRSRFLLRLRQKGSGTGDDETTVVGARFVVDATGPKACFARHRGARRRLLDRLVCACGFFASGSAAGFGALTVLEATEYGWWYAARLPEERLAVAVATDPEILRRQGLHRESGWLDRLAGTRHLAPRMAAGAVLEGALVIRAAPTFRLDRPAGRRWLAVGDAAAAYDPLSSQGIHKALLDGLEAAEEIAAALDAGADLGGGHRSRIVERFEAYLANRNHFYGLETRWPASPFWARRREQGARWTGRSRRAVAS